jgi:hypothetical protein
MPKGGRIFPKTPELLRKYHSDFKKQSSQDTALGIHFNELRRLNDDLREPVDGLSDAVTENVGDHTHTNVLLIDTVADSMLSDAAIVSQMNILHSTAMINYIANPQSGPPPLRRSLESMASLIPVGGPTKRQRVATPMQNEINFTPKTCIVCGHYKTWGQLGSAFQYYHEVNKPCPVAEAKWISSETVALKGWCDCTICCSVANGVHKKPEASADTVRKNKRIAAQEARRKIDR